LRFICRRGIARDRISNLDGDAVLVFRIRARPDQHETLRMAVDDMRLGIADMGVVLPLQHRRIPRDQPLGRGNPAKRGHKAGQIKHLLAAAGLREQNQRRTGITFGAIDRQRALGAVELQLIKGGR